MESLIRSLLDAATIRTGHLSLVRAPQDLSALVHEAVDTYRMLAEEKSQVLLVEVPPSLPVDGDRERLLQVLSNLLANAVKFAPGEGTITTRAWGTEGWVHCSVSDDGPGIEPDELERVFDPYWSGGVVARDGPRALHRQGHRGGPRRRDIRPERAEGRNDHRLPPARRLGGGGQARGADPARALEEAEARVILTRPGRHGSRR